MSVRKTGSFPGPIDTQINEIIRAIRDLESRIPVIPNEVERSIEAERALYSDRADMLSMARLINGVGFDGTKDITITAAPNEHNHIISRDDLTEDVNNSIIVESGSNANGEYVRWGNGLQVCWCFTNDFVYLDSRDLHLLWTFPSVFSAATPAFTGGFPSSGAAYPGKIIVDYSHSIMSSKGLTSVGLYLRTADSAITWTESDKIIGVPVYAVGRWK